MAMNRQRRTANISNIFSYDDAGNIVIKDYSQVTRYSWNGTIHGFVGQLSVSSVSAAVTDTDKFLVSDGGVLKYRTGAEVLSDIGGQPILTNPVTGTGVTGQVAYWNGTNSQTGSNNLFWDAANARLGIGTNAPAYKLDVNGNQRVNGSINISNANGLLINNILNATSNGDQQTGLGVNVSFVDGAFTGVNHYALQIAGSGYSQLTANVGAFNLPTNGFGLQVGWNKSNGGGETSLWFNKSAGSTGGLFIGENVAGTGTYFAKFSATTGNLVLQNGGTFTDSGQRLQVQGTTLLNGNVGIGSTSTSSNLGISKNITGAASSTGLSISGVIQSDVTGQGSYITIYPATQAAVFTTYVCGIELAQINKGVGSNIIDEYGILIRDKTGGVNGNYGIYSQVVSGNNKYNLYIIGTANNYMAGSLGIGSTSLTGYGLRVSKNITGAITTASIQSDGQIQSDVTGSVFLMSTNPSTVNSPFTLGNLFHYRASQSSFGTGSIVTNQYGFFANSSIIDATYNFGFYGDIPNGTNRWNIYMNGTANNYMAGSLGIGNSSLVGFNLKVEKNITGTSTGYGILSSGSLLSDIVTGTYYQTYSSVQNTAFTVINLRHYYATGASSFGLATVTNQFGFIADSALIGATNNYGFYGNIPNAANRWNIYMAGTADNYLAGKLLIGTTTVGTFALDVVGETRLNGSGNTNATAALNVQNSDGRVIVRAFNNGAIQVGNLTSNSIYPFSSSIGTPDIQGTSIAFSTSLLTSGNSIGFRNAQTTNRDYTSGDGTFIRLYEGYAPTSGTGTWQSLVLTPTINQTGGANGITRGLYVQPTLTAATDWRSIEWSNNTGWGLYGAGTANNYLGGALGIGTTSLTNRALSIQKTMTGTVNGNSIIQSSIIASDVTSTAVNNFSQFTTQAAAFNIDNVYHYYNTNITLGAGSSVSNQYGYFVSNLTSATNNYGFYGTLANGTNRWNLYMNGTADNYLAGNLGIGTNAPAYRLHNVGSAAFDNGASNDAITFLNQGFLKWSLVRFRGFANSFDFQDNVYNTKVSLSMVGSASIFNTGGNFLFGGSTDSGQRLQVYGDAFIKGSGTTSATNALLVQNSATTTLVYIDNSGQAYFNNRVIVNRIQPLTSANIVEIAGGIGSASGGSGIGLNQFTNVTNTSGTHNRVESTGSFLPTSGTGVFNMFQATGTINQTGGANGITRGLYVNPTLTAAADWRSIEWSNNTGWGLYGAGTANNYLAGATGVGTSTMTYKFNVSDTTTYVAGFRGPASSYIVVGDTSLAGESGVNFRNSSGQGFIAVGGTVLGISATSGANTITLSTGGFERLRVTSAGRLLLGTTTESTYLLDVNGTARVSNTLSVITTSATNDVAIFKATEPYITVEAAGASNSASIFLKPSTSAQNATIQNRTGGGLEFYTGATPSISAIIKSTGAVVVSSTLGLNGVEDSVKSGKYTPTLTNGTNVASSAVNANTFKYIRVGSTVNVSGWLSLAATSANTLTELEISLPIASNITSDEDVSGVANTLSGGYGQIRDNTTNNTAKMYIQPTSTSNLVWYMEFSYVII